MKHLDYINYFKALATNHKMIGNGNADGQFINIDLFDKPTTKPTGLKWKKDKYAMVVVDLEVNDSGPNHDQRLWKNDCEVWIVATTGKEDKPKIAIVKNESLEIAKQILAQMIVDSDNDDDPLHWLYGLVDGSWTLSKIGPIWDDVYGYRILFTVEDDASVDLTVDPTKWL
jgi:hypothetical protein